jgi:outer membrane protein assembly factor BamE
VSTFARSSSRRLKAAFAIAAITVALAGCSSGKWGFPYKAPVQQGNWITSEQVALLRTGMTREQVRFALGSPTLTSVLHADRWDYPYYYKPGYGAAQERKFTVWFQDDKVMRWDGDQQPDVQPFQLADEQAKAAARARSEANNAAAQRGVQAPGTGTSGGLPAGVTAPSGSGITNPPADAAPAGGAPAQGAVPGTPSSATPTGTPGTIPGSPAQPMQ